MTTPPLGWGLDPYGTGVYGSSMLGTGISLVSATAVGTRLVDVVLSGPAMHVSTSSPGDALNPATWIVQNLDTLEYLDVVTVTALTPSSYQLLTLEPFGPVSVTHRVSSLTLKDVAGNLLIPPRHADFYGIMGETVTDPDQLAAGRGAYARDISNPQTPAESLGVLGGTLVLTSGGDYETVTGSDLVRKLLVRRLLTSPGDFFHLPEYGIGFRLKEPIAAANLVSLKAEIEQQARREPEVEEALASVTLDANGILTVMLRARLKSSGQQIDVKVPVASGVTL
jgi:hypothetical protein